MQLKTLDRGEAQKAMNAWLDGYPNLPEIDKDYLQVREDIEKISLQIASETESVPKTRKDYFTDLYMGLELYDYFWNQPGFTLRFAENDGFWRYLSISVAPHIVEKRWGKDNTDHFWGKSTRIWFRSVWWYIHLSWQGDKETTKKILSKNPFSTDTILNFVERSGRAGTCVEAYRNIIYFYSTLTENDFKRYRERRTRESDDPFRVIMKLNTAKMLIMEPALSEGGERGYAKKLFKDAGIELHVT